jgi:hypothetical protein
MNRDVLLEVMPVEEYGPILFLAHYEVATTCPGETTCAKQEKLRHLVEYFAGVAGYHDLEHTQIDGRDDPERARAVLASWDLDEGMLDGWGRGRLDQEERSIQDPIQDP